MLQVQSFQPFKLNIAVRSNWVTPVGVKQRGCRSTVGEAEGVSRRPLVPSHYAVEPPVSSFEYCPCVGDTLTVAILCCADAVKHGPLHRHHDLVVEEPVIIGTPSAARIPRGQPHRPGMMETDMFDDDARFHHHAGLVHENGNALERPQGLVLGRRLLGRPAPAYGTRDDLTEASVQS
jgi:hypothetical protein